MAKPVELPQGTLEILILKTETAKWADMAAVVAGILDTKAGEI